MNLAEWTQGIPALAEGAIPTPDLAPALHHRFADSFHTAPGWRELGVEYSCIPDAQYPWDPDVMREIRKIVPDAIPMWVRWAFLSPREKGDLYVKVFGRHAIGRCIRNLGASQSPFRCEMPTMPCQGLWFRRPNRIWFIHQGPMSYGRDASLPGEYQPFDGFLLKKIEDTAVDFNQTEKEFIEAEKDRLIGRQVRASESFWAAKTVEMAERDADFNAYRDKQMEKISDSEMDAYAASAAERIRERKKKAQIVVP